MGEKKRREGNDGAGSDLSLFLKCLLKGKSIYWWAVIHSSTWHLVMVWEILPRCIWGLQPEACLIPDGWKGVAFFPLVFCAEDAFQMKIPWARDNIRGKLSFPGPRKATLGGMEARGPRCRVFLVTRASMSHLQSPVDMGPCKYLSISISANVHSARASPCVNVWTNPPNSTPKIESRCCVKPRLGSHAPVLSLVSPRNTRWPTGDHRSTRMQSSSRKRGGGQRVSLQVIKSDGGHVSFQNVSGLLTLFGNTCKVTLSIRIYSHTAWGLWAFKEPRKKCLRARKKCVSLK